MDDLERRLRTLEAKVEAVEEAVDTALNWIREAEETANLVMDQLEADSELEVVFVSDFDTDKIH